jgi:hypothetical protein
MSAMVSRYKPGQVAHIAAASGKGGDHFGIGEILLLRGLRQRQVLRNQPGHQFGVFLVETMRATEAACIDRAQAGMIAAAAFGDVVEQRGQKQNLLAFELVHQPVREREFVGVLRHRQPAQIAQHHQDMFIDRIDMELVMLHLAGDAAEQRDIAAKDAEPMHQPHGQRDAFRLAQQADEAAMVGRVAPKRRHRCRGRRAPARAAGAACSR